MAEQQLLSSAATFLDTLYNRYKTNRDAWLTVKWTRNRAAYYKRPDLDPRTWTDGEKRSDKGKTVFDVTKQKILAGVTIIYDMLCMGGRLAFMLVPDDLGQGSGVAAKPETGNLKPESGGEGAGGSAGGVALPTAGAGQADFSQEQSDLDLMQRRIDRQLEACNARAELHKTLLSGGIYGDFWTKFFESEIIHSSYQQLAPGLFDLVEVKEPAPAFEYKSPWNMFHDLEANSDEKMEAVVERDFFSTYEIRKLLGKPFYITSAIRRVLQAATDTIQGGSGGQGANSNLPPHLQEICQRTRTIEVREFWTLLPEKLAQEFEDTMLTPEERAACGGIGPELAEFPGDDQTEGEEENGSQGRMAPTEASSQKSVVSGQNQESGGLGQPALPSRENDLDDKGNDVYIHAITADREIIRWVRVTRDDWAFLHDVWELNLDGQGGISIADNVDQEQMVLNGAVRALEESTKLLGQLILAVKREYVDGDLEALRTGKVIEINGDCRDIREAIMQLKLDDVTAPLYKIIELFTGMVDQVSMIPRIEQGQQTMEAQTLGELRERLDKAGKYLGSVIQRYDRLVERIVMHFYRWNMEDPNLTEGKGNYRVKALGFSSFMNKIVRLQNLINLLQLILKDQDLKSMSKLKWLFAEIIKGNDIDPDQIIKSIAEMQAEAAQQQALLAQDQAAGAGKQADTALMEANIQRLLAESRKNDADAQLKLVQAEAKKRGITLDTAKTVTDLEGKRAEAARQNPEVSVQNPVGGVAENGGLGQPALPAPAVPQAA